MFYRSIVLFLFALFPAAIATLFLPSSIAEVSYYQADEQKPFYSEQASSLNFKNNRILRSRIAKAWIENRGDIPKKFPKHKLGYKGTFIIPDDLPDGSYTLQIDSSFPFEFFYNDKSIVKSTRNFKRTFQTDVLSAGEYPFSLLLLSSHRSILKKTRSQQHFFLRLRSPDGVLYKLEYLEKASMLQKVGSSFLGVVIIFVLCLLLWPRGRSEVSTILEEYRVPLGFVMILLFSILLRSVDYGSIPAFLETADEYNNSWIGYHLLRDGTPRGWGFTSMVGEGEKVSWFGNNFNLIDAKFHPMPTFSLIVGSFLHLCGIDDMYKISLGLTRIVPIVLSGLTAGLVFLVGVQTLGLFGGALSGIFYSVFPLAVLNGRLVKDDVLLGLVVMLALYFLGRYKKDESVSNTTLLVLFASFGCIIKQTGIFLPVAVCFLLAQEGRWRLVATIVLSTAFFLGVYFSYGYLIDWDQFQRQCGYLSNFRVDFKSMSAYFAKDTVAHSIMGRGSMVWLWICFAAFATWKRTAVSSFILLYLLVLVLARMDGATYGWYYITLFPLLSICAGYLLVKWYEESSPWYAVIFLLLFCSSQLELLQLDRHVTVDHVRIAVVLFLSPYFLYLVFPQRWLWITTRVMTLVLIVLTFSVQIYTVMRLGQLLSI